ncbi:sugar ABC transporter ATP-binding protein [Pectobacterium cacticida]|uniref:Sugar ABC transporter ATP-binding protein n=1 Tax=Pectobacterium cacticida TaxID=69221 RepID=A0ABZ2GC44_9GAMM|nr:sugar ABC transporter ATP-binding protein [Pectobacterium cacticida]UYX06591.1 sugar ABC transporter ATP-binding protein [Pectobacterium cacticida]
MLNVQTDGTALLRLEGVGKRFPGVIALDNIDLTLRRGEIHALLGENGAGKSTLIRILTGIHRADSGNYLLNGEAVRMENPQMAQRLGVSLVPQDILMVPNFSIGRNILLGSEGLNTRKDRLSAEEADRVALALSRVGATFSPHTLTCELSVPHLRLAQIARALLNPGDLLILDEPTAVLSEHDAEQLLDRLEQLRDQGKSILYVTHRLGEVMRMADCFTILRDGKNVGYFRRNQIDRPGIVECMAKPGGTAVADVPARTKPLNSNTFPRLKVTQLSGQQFSDVSMYALPGEIVGIAGVQGAGHGNLLRTIAGADPHHQGDVLLDSRTLFPLTSRNALNQGILLVPADRRGAAIIPNLSIRANIALSARVRQQVRRWGLRWHKAEWNMAQQYVDDLTIRPGSADTPIGTLSGGNQQKVVLARALESKARLLLIEEPTQGVDVRAKAEIHALLRQAAWHNDCTLVIASSEFEELIGLADRIYVMQSGRLVKELTGQEASYKTILEHALS